MIFKLIIKLFSKEIFYNFEYKKIKILEFYYNKKLH